MDKEQVLKYMPVVAVVIATIFQWNLFVTPETLEIKHREILDDVSKTYATKEQTNDVKMQINDIQKKIDKIYEIITNKN